MRYINLHLHYITLHYITLHYVAVMYECSDVVML